MNATLIFHVITRDASLLDAIALRLGLETSAVRHRSEPQPAADGTTGQWLMTTVPMATEELVDIERLLDRLEKTYAQTNPDAGIVLMSGYSTGARIVLASRVDAAHRIPLKSNVLAELVATIADGEVHLRPEAPDFAKSVAAKQFFVAAQP